MSNFDTFISALQRLLSALFLRDLARRVANYRRSTSATPEKELAAALDNLIDSSLANATHSNQPDATSNDSPATQSPTRPVKSSSAESRKTLAGEDHPEETAQDRNPATRTHHIANGLGRKLWSSSLEHIHAAHRYALKGDSTNAKLHTTIAKEAIKDASRYLSDDEYEGFVAQIRAELRSLPE
ncbi:MAG: hypothetical protein AMJ68_02060 [Acidithiobacillales bacterium SG8_45]|nr:MAG: hypothetical protein AMJ68_02060 [Acidithiobacillales bacterium SG8_45]